MPKVFTSKSQQIGELGETIAVQYLEKKGYKIIEKNFTTRLGEIDIIAFSHETLYFIEVKAVTREKMDKYDWKPHQNFHQQKLHKMIKTVQYYLSRHKRVGESKLLLATVVIDQEKRIGKVSLETIY
jgi:putative endonuclease